MVELSRIDFQKLVESPNSTNISIYMPAEKAGAETRKNPIMFKNLLQEAEAKIAQIDDGKSEIIEVLNSAKNYIEDYDFWQHQDLGLAFFINTDGIQYYRLPYSFKQQIKVSDRFYLKPLLPVITNNSKFYLLALAQNQVNFFLGSHYSIKQIELPESIPASLAEALKYDDPEKQIQYHSGDTGNSPIYHGQGIGTTDNKDEIRRFFQQIDRGLQEVLQEENTPLILAGVEFLLPIYHEVNSYNNLLKTGITGNPENADPADLHQKAWDIIEPHLETERKQAIDKFNQLANTEEASSQIEQVISAAVVGQVDTLFVVKNAQYMGEFDLQSNQVTIHSEVNNNSIDLINLATTKTYLQGGKIYILEFSEMPDDTAISAIFRYPVYASATEVTV
ncbi:MAG: hypothetical protein ACFCAD_13565 [Pleurocapsa sp.]